MSQLSAPWGLLAAGETPEAAWPEAVRKGGDVRRLRGVCWGMAAGLDVIMIRPLHLRAWVRSGRLEPWLCQLQARTSRACTCGGGRGGGGVSFDLVEL